MSPVSHCLTDTSTRGVAVVPKLALDVMSCEVMRVLQLTDSCIVPVSYQVPRKVPQSGQQVHDARNKVLMCSCVNVCSCAFDLPSSRIQVRSFMMTFTQIQSAQLRPCLLRSGGREGTSRYQIQALSDDSSLASAQPPQTKHSICPQVDKVSLHPNKRPKPLAKQAPAKKELSSEGSKDVREFSL